MGKLNGNSIVEKARSFAKILVSSREFQEYYSAQKKLEQDNEALSLLEQFHNKQGEIQEARMRGRSFVSGKALEEVEMLRSKVESNPTITSWAQAQQDVIDLIQEANQVISNAVGFNFGQISSSGGGSC